DLTVANAARLLLRRHRHLAFLQELHAALGSDAHLSGAVQLQPAQGQLARLARDETKRGGHQHPGLILWRELLLALGRAGAGPDEQHEQTETGGRLHEAQPDKVGRRDRSTDAEQDGRTGEPRPAYTYGAGRPLEWGRQKIREAVGVSGLDPLAVSAGRSAGPHDPVAGWPGGRRSHTATRRAGPSS